MAIPYPASYQQGSYAVLVHQGLFGFAANSEASLLTAMNTLKLKNGIIKENTKTKLIQNELKAAFNVDNPKKIDKQALINLMESKLGITLSAADEAALLSQKQVTIVAQILARADVVNKFQGPIDAFLQDAAVDPTNFQTNLNNIAPTDILPNDASIAENAPGGSLITTLTAVDPDAGDTFTFSLVDDPDNLFDVLGNGQVRLKAGAQLDFETDTSHQLTVKVVDQFGNSYQETITINVTDVDPEPGNTIVLKPELEFINNSNGATVNDDTFIGNTVFNQATSFNPVTINGTATPGDILDGDDGEDTLSLTIAGSVFLPPFGQVVSNGVVTDNIEKLIVTNALVSPFGTHVAVDMTTHNDVVDVELRNSNTDIMLRDWQNAGGKVKITDPVAGTSTQIDYDIQALAGGADELSVVVNEMTGGSLLVTQNAEGGFGGGLFGGGDPAALEKLNVAFEGPSSQIDAIVSPLTSTFIFTGPSDAIIGIGPNAIDTFGGFPPYTSADSFFDDMGNNAATVINASGMGGSLYINLSEAPGGGHNFAFTGSAGNDTTVIGDSMRESGNEGSTFDGGGGQNLAVLWDELSVGNDANANGTANNPLVNYQTVLLTEEVGLRAGGGTMDARFVGTAARSIVLADGLSSVGGLGLTVTNVDALAAGTIFNFTDEPQLGFTDDDAFNDAFGRNQTMTFLTSAGAPAANVIVHFNDATNPAGNDDINFAGGNVGTMEIGGTGGRDHINADFDGGMDALTKLTVTGSNRFELLSTGDLAVLAEIDASANTGGIEMQDAALPGVQSVAGHQVASDITSGVSGMTIRGSSASDVLVGTNGGDTIQGNGGDDIIFGNGGNDNINAGAGNDAVNGGDGNDTVLGEGGNDIIVGGDGGDTLLDGGADNDTVYGWAGNDRLNGGEGRDIVKGGAGEDVVGGGLGVDHHWGDFSGVGEPASGAGSPQTSTVTISNVNVGDVYTVSVSGYGAVPDILVSVTATSASATAVASALVLALEGAGLPAANVSSAGGVITILGQDNTDVFTVNAAATNLPGVATIDFSAGHGQGDVFTVNIDGNIVNMVVTELTASSVAVANFVLSQLPVVPNVTYSLAGDVITAVKSTGSFTTFTASYTDQLASAFVDINVTDLEDGEQVSVIVDGTTFTRGGVGQTAEEALGELADAIIAQEASQPGGLGGGFMTYTITETAPGSGSFTLRIIDSVAADANGWGDAAADIISNVQVLGGDGGTGNTPTASYLPGVANVQPVVAVTAGTPDDGGTAVSNGLPTPDAIDNNTGFFSDTFVIQTNDAATNITVLVSASDDGLAGLADDVITTDADALASMDIVWDWNAGLVPDKLNFALLNEVGSIVNYDEDDGATSLLDAIASINGMLGSGVKFAAAEVLLGAGITANYTASVGAEAVTTATAGAGYHTVVGADANGDGLVDQLVILVGVGSGAAGVDGFTQTDIVALPA